MATRLAALSQNAAADAVTARANGGTVEIRTGTQPATGDTTATGTLLATLTLSATAAAAASAGVATLNTVTGDSSIDNTGTAGWFRVKSSGGNPVWDGSCGTTGADMNFNSVSFVAGGTANVTAWTYTHPAS